MQQVMRLCHHRRRAAKETCMSNNKQTPPQQPSTCCPHSAPVRGTPSKETSNARQQSQKWTVSTLELQTPSRFSRETLPRYSDTVWWHREKDLPSAFFGYRLSNFCRGSIRQYWRAAPWAALQHRHQQPISGNTHHSSALIVPEHLHIEKERSAQHFFRPFLTSNNRQPAHRNALHNVGPQGVPTLLTGGSDLGFQKPG